MNNLFLKKELYFPPIDKATKEGIVAVGGDLSTERLLLAYNSGIFPWFSEEDPIIWWSPDPRFVLFPENMKISDSMKKVLKKNIFNITFDRAFSDVIKKCRELRLDKEGTWITEEMISSYTKLHEMGFAHSAEAWLDGELVGGLYGLSLGSCFFGESMFSKIDNASKAAFIKLVEKLRTKNFSLIDCQVYTKHLESLGAQNIQRKDFLKHLEISLQKETLSGSWNNF